MAIVMSWLIYHFSYSIAFSLRRTNYSDTSSASPIWKTLWKLPAPTKVKIHCWRALLGAIPCLRILANRHMIPSFQCPMCLQNCETVNHAFFGCQRAKEIWRILGFAHTLNNIRSSLGQAESILSELFRL